MFRPLIYLWAYRLVLFPHLWVGLWLLSFFNKKIAAGFSARKKISGVYPWLNFPKGTQPIWFHCSSMEFEYAKPVIREIKRQNPQQTILVTYFSPSAQKAVTSFEGVDFACPLPWDFHWTIKEFIKFHNPKMLLYARTDVWPEVTVQCVLNDIPVGLFSATLAKTSSRMRPISLGFTRWCYSLLTHIYCVSESDKSNFKRAGIEQNCQVLGDTRYDQALFRLQNPKPLKGIFQNRASGLRTVVFGSTWPEDDRVILSSLDKFKFDNLCFIIVPHEPIPGHMQHFSDHKIELYSSIQRPLVAGDIMVVDQIGILAELYAHADLAFVGGSFKKNVHSVMESLAAGCLTLVGPNYENNREAVEFLDLTLRNGGPTLTAPVSVVRTPEEMARALLQVSKLSDVELRAICDEVKSLVNARSGVSRKLVNKILFS